MNEITTIDNNEFEMKIASMKDANVYIAEDFISQNPDISYIYSPSAEFPLLFEQTKSTLVDVENYRNFVKNCIRRFRQSRFYKRYKAYLMCMGLDRCQILGNISSDMANIEMHHNFLTIFDISILISQHILNTVGKITSFDLISLLIQEHQNNNIPIVMLSETMHELYHSDPDNRYIPISMTFGKWWDLLIKYRYGITLDIAAKVISYIEKCQQNNELNDKEFFSLKESMESWGRYNEYLNDHINNNYNNNFMHNGYINN